MKHRITDSENEFYHKLFTRSQENKRVFQNLLSHFSQKDNKNMFVLRNVFPI